MACHDGSWVGAAPDTRVFETNFRESQLWSLLRPSPLALSLQLVRSPFGPARGVYDQGAEQNDGSTDR